MAYIGRQNLGGAYRQLDDISSGFDGSDTTHTMQVNSANVTVGDVNQIILSLGGVIQKPGTDFTVSGSVLTFTTAPAANTSFFAVLLGSDNGGTVTPTDGSVTTDKFASNATLTTTGTITTQGTSTTGGTITLENTDTGGAANDYFGKLIFKGNDSSSSASGTRASVEGKVTGNFGSSQIDFLTASGGASAARIATLSPDGLSLADGNITFEGSGHGIHLGVTSANAANLLDDYEEGDFAVTTTYAQSGSWGLATSSDTLHYIKVGKLVSVQGLLILNAHSSASGICYIDLPFTPSNQTENGDYAVATIQVVNATKNSNTFTAYAQPNLARLYFDTIDATSLGNAALAAWDADTIITISIVYHST